MSSEQLGPLVRLWGLTTAELPPEAVTSDDLAPLLMAILQEAVPFIDDVAPKNPNRASGSAKSSWKSKGTKTYPDSTAKVEVYERTIPVSELEVVVARNDLPHGIEAKLHPEVWACRRSVHEDAVKKGTASWDEFVKNFKDNHTEAEAAFTPNITAARTALEWSCNDVEAEEGGETWTKFTLKVEESKHKIGSPLNDRVFAVLQMTTAAEGIDEFLVVSVALPDFATSSHSKICKEKGVIFAAYSSVERIRKLPSGEIEWIMATASDAKGVLPHWVQAKAVPGQIAKDVTLFLSWVAKERAADEPAKEPEDKKAKEEPQAQTEDTPAPVSKEEEVKEAEANTEEAPGPEVPVKTENGAVEQKEEEAVQENGAAVAAK